MLRGILSEQKKLPHPDLRSITLTRLETSEKDEKLSKSSDFIKCRMQVATFIAKAVKWDVEWKVKWREYTKIKRLYTKKNNTGLNFRKLMGSRGVITKKRSSQCEVPGAYNIASLYTSYFNNYSFYFTLIPEISEI